MSLPLGSAAPAEGIVGAAVLPLVWRYEQPYDPFISYKSENLEWVRRLKRSLEAMGVKVRASSRPALVGGRVTSILCGELDYVPGRFVVNRIVRPRLACRACETICQAPLPTRPIERGRPPLDRGSAALSGRDQPADVPAS